ncbi:MAG: SapC family protein [Desulfobacterales bacterium]
MEPKENKEKNDFIKTLSTKDHADLVFAGCDNCTMCCDGSTYTSANVLLNEMFDTAKLFPVVFSKNGDKLSLSLLYTLAKGVPCPYLDMSTKRCAVYDSIRPRACKIYPFNVRGMASSGNTLSYSVVFDSRCPGLREQKDSGVPLIGKDGRLSEKITQNFVGASMLRDYRENLLQTEEFLNLIKECDLLTEQQYNIVEHSASGYYGQNTIRVWKISEERLSALDPEAVMKFHKKHFFNAIYTHLNSLGNFDRLIRLKREYDSRRADLLTFRI